MMKVQALQKMKLIEHSGLDIVNVCCREPSQQVVNYLILDVDSSQIQLVPSSLPYSLAASKSICSQPSRASASTSSPPIHTSASDPRRLCPAISNCSTREGRGHRTDRATRLQGAIREDESATTLKLTNAGRRSRSR